MTSQFDDIRQRRERIERARLRRFLLRAKRDGSLTDDAVAKALPTRFWLGTGHATLMEYLQMELCFDVKRAGLLVLAAIRSNYEEPENYRIGREDFEQLDAACQQETRDRPAGDRRAVGSTMRGGDPSDGRPDIGAGGDRPAGGA